MRSHYAGRGRASGSPPGPGPQRAPSTRQAASEPDGTATHATCALLAWRTSRTPRRRPLRRPGGDCARGRDAAPHLRHPATPAGKEGERGRPAGSLEGLPLRPRQTRSGCCEKRAFTRSRIGTPSARSLSQYRLCAAALRGKMRPGRRSCVQRRGERLLRGPPLRYRFSGA